MSSNASDISGTKFGYDFVVATTQASINATMLNFFSTRKEPTVVVCFVADSKGNPVIIDYDLLKRTHMAPIHSLFIFQLARMLPLIPLFTISSPPDSLCFPSPDWHSSRVKHVVVA